MFMYVFIYVKDINSILQSVDVKDFIVLLQMVVTTGKHVACVKIYFPLK